MAPRGNLDEESEGARPIRETLADPGPSPLESLLTKERIGLLRKAIASLPAAEADLLGRHYGLSDGEVYTVQQLAVRERQSVAQIAYRLRLARAHLKELLS